MDSSDEALLMQLLQMKLVPFFCFVFYVLSRHSDSKSSSKERKGFSAVEEDMSDVYPLQLRLSVLWETNVLAVKISKKVCNF